MVHSSVFYQDGGTQEGNTVLVSGCRVSSATRGFKFQAFKSLNFDNVIDASDVDTLAYIGRNGINVIGGTYQIDGAQITYSDLAGTIATAEIGDTQVTDAKIAAMAATKLTGTIATARLPNLNASQTTAGTFATAQIPSLPASQIASGTFDVARIPALPTSVLSDAATLVKTSGDQSIGGQKTWTGAQLNTGGLYGLGTVSFQGTSSKAVTIQSSNPGGGVNSELRLVTANNTDASNVTYNTGVLKYNGATSTLEMDKPLSVTGAITSTVAFANTVTLDSNQAVGGEKAFTAETPRS